MDQSISKYNKSEPYNNNNGTISVENLPLSDDHLKLWGNLDYFDIVDTSNSLTGFLSLSWATDWMIGRYEYQEPSATSFCTPSALRRVNPEMKLQDFSSSSFPPPPIPMTYTTSIANRSNTVYPIPTSGDLVDYYSLWVCSKASDNTAVDYNMASWESRILNSTDSSPCQPRAQDIASQDSKTGRSRLDQSRNYGLPSQADQPRLSHSIPYTSSKNATTTTWPCQSQNSNISNLTSHSNSYWKPPNHPLETITPFIDPTPFASTLTTTLHFFHSHSLLYKSGVTTHELHMHLAAGSCGVTIHGTVSIPANANCNPNEKLGLILSQEIPLNPRLYLPTQRKKISESMRRVVSELHTKDIVHGDIHLSNFLLCSAGKSDDQVTVKLSSFHNFLFVSDSSSQTLNNFEEDEPWTPVLNGTIVSPNRANDWMKGRDRKATKEDDLFALGICMWELWSGKKYDEMCGVWEDVRRGDLKERGVDLKGVGDKEVRAWVRTWLRGGGAIV